MSSHRLQQVTVRHLLAGHDLAGAGSGAALHEITLAIAQGEQVAIIGPSGAGKTTLLATLACAQRPASGSFHMFELDPWALSEAARHRLRARLFLAPQTAPLPPRQRVVTAVLAARLPQWSLWRALLSLLKPQEAEAAYEALTRFQLGDKLYARVDRLSGGERQRCALARVILSQAETFLIDEPLSALDPALAQVTLAALQQEATRRGASLICSLHQVDVARACFSRIIALRDGRIVFDLPREAVTDAMITALYQHESAPEAASVQGGAPMVPLAPRRLTSGACL